MQCGIYKQFYKDCCFQLLLEVINIYIYAQNYMHLNVEKLRSVRKCNDRSGLGRVVVWLRERVERVARQSVVAPLLSIGEVHRTLALVEAACLIPLQYVKVQPTAAIRRCLLSMFIS